MRSERTLKLSRVERRSRNPMSSKFLINAASVLLLLVACAPQAELVKTRSDMNDVRTDIRTLKERVQDLQKRIDSLDANTKGTSDTQKALADYGARADQLAMDIQLLQGKLEENNFRISELGQKLDDRGVKIAELSSRIEALEKAKAGAAGAAATGQTTTTKAEPKTIEPSEAYRQAKSDYDKGNFELALTGFQYYLVHYPGTSQADAARYWIGECYYSLKEFDKAIDSFARVIKDHPKSDKVAGAKLKIGLSYLNERNSAKAKEYLRRVIKDHPGTTEAKIAKDRLAKIK